MDRFDDYQTRVKPRPGKPIPKIKDLGAIFASLTVQVVERIGDGAEGLQARIEVAANLGLCLRGLSELARRYGWRLSDVAAMDVQKLLEERAKDDRADVPPSGQ